MNKKHYIIFLIIIIIIPMTIWSIYFIGKQNGISTSITAGDLLMYIGSIFTAIATVFAVKLSITHNRKEIDKQFKREIQRTHDENLYDEICNMAKDIMISLSLSEFLSSLDSILESTSAKNLSGEARNAAFAIVNKTRGELIRLNKLQWYYHEILKKENFFLTNTSDSQNVKDYFIYIYNLIDKIDTKLSENADFKGVSYYHNFFEDVDKLIFEYQHEVTEKTSNLIKSMKSILTTRIICDNIKSS